MELWKLLIFYLLCTILQGFFVYKSQNIDCELQYECFDGKQKDDFGLPRIKLLLYQILVIFCLPLFYLFNILYKRQHFTLVFLLTTLLYLIINVIILLFICSFILTINSIKTKEIDYNRKLCKQVQYCEEGILFQILQIIMFSVWQIIFTYLYLLQNGLYNSMMALFGRLGLLCRIILVNISILWLLWDNLNIYLTIEKIFFLINFYYEFEFYALYVILGQLLILDICLINVIVLQIKELLATRGYNRRINKWLNLIIIQTQISLPFFIITFNPINNIFSNYFLFFFYLYLFIQLNYYSSIFVKQELKQQFIETNIIYCSQCKDFITQNDQIIYFKDSTDIFHQSCLIQQELNQQNVNFQNYLNKYNKPNQNQNLYLLFILYLINWIFISNLLSEYYVDDLFQTNYFYVEYVQFTIIYLLGLFNNLKYFKLYFCLYLLGCLTYFINFPTNYLILEDIYLFFVDCKEYVDIQICYWYYYTLSTKFIIYNFVTTFIQAYQLSYIIKFDRITSRLHLIIFYFFILVDLQLLIYMLYLFKFFVEDFYIIPLFILAIIVLFNYVTTKIDNIDQYEKITSKLFIKKIISIILLFLLFILLIVNYYIIKLFKFEYFITRFLIKFTYSIIIIQQIFFLQWLYHIEAEDLIQNKQIKFCNREELLTPHIIQYNCHRCGKDFQKGQVILYFIDCKHFIHKQCIIQWINYQCCKMDQNKVIEININ